MTDPAKIEAIKTWPEPQNVRKVRSFLGLANFYRKFIDSHSAIAKPLSDLLKSTEFKEKFGHQVGKLAKLKFRNQGLQCLEGGSDFRTLSGHL